MLYREPPGAPGPGYHSSQTLMSWGWVILLFAKCRTHTNFIPTRHIWKWSLPNRRLPLCPQPMDINALATLMTTLAMPTLDLSTPSVPRQTVIDIYNGPGLGVVSPDTFCALVRVRYKHQHCVSQNQRRSQRAQPGRWNEAYEIFLLGSGRDDRSPLICHCERLGCSLPSGTCTHLSTTRV